MVQQKCIIQCKFEYTFIIKTLIYQLPNYFSHLLENLMLHENEDRSNLVCEHVGVCSRSQPFSSQGGYIKPTGQLVEKARMALKNHFEKYVKIFFICNLNYIQMNSFCHWITLNLWSWAQRQVP